MSEGVNIVKTIKTIYKHINIFINDSTKLMNQLNGIGLVDARGKKWFCSIYQKGKLILDLCLINELDLKKWICKYGNLKITKNTEINPNQISKNFFKIKKDFKKVDDYLNLSPLYVKDFNE